MIELRYIRRYIKDHPPVIGYNYQQPTKLVLQQRHRIGAGWSAWVDVPEIVDEILPEEKT